MLGSQGISAAQSLEILAPLAGRAGEVLTPEALTFVTELEKRFNDSREALLSQRVKLQARLDDGLLPDFLPETKTVRDAGWKICALPDRLCDRRVEITGPVERKMMINALNSGARVFMADFEDSTSPTWENIIGGQVNLCDAVDGTIEFIAPDGKMYRLADRIATIMVRPRGWHLLEKHVHLEGRPISASLFDFGLFFFHNAKRLIQQGGGPYFYLPKLESHLEARLWNDIFCFAQDRLGIARGTIKATVLIETILAAFEMDEILFELKDHSAGLNAGRWDYLFSIIKKFRGRSDFLFPERAQVTMTVPFMRAYAGLLVKTCHRRGAPAIGGMAAFIPSRKDAKVNDVALSKVREDKVRESRDGFDGTWVAHPDLVPVAAAAFDEVLGRQHNQIARQRDDVQVGSEDLLDFHIPSGSVTESGIRSNVSVALQYIESWLRGVGAAAIFNLMEDAATAEIARAQIWQWIRHGATLQDGTSITRQLIVEIEAQELMTIRDTIGPEAFSKGRFFEAQTIFESVALGEEFVDFLTVPSYDYLN